jgi:acyl carrier protein
MIPSMFVIVDALAMTPSGKIDRRRLPETDNLRPTPDEPYAPPRTPTEGDLAAIWAEVLALERVGIDDNFFDLGGHSLAAARIISRVAAAFHVELPLTILFDRPTVAAMALEILAEQASSAHPQLIEEVFSEVEAMIDNDTQRSMRNNNVT